MDSHEGGAARLLGRRCPRGLSFSIDKILQPDFGCQRSGHVLPQVRAGFHNCTTGFQTAAWSLASGDNPSKVSETSASDDLLHSIRGLLDVEEVTFPYPGLFSNGFLGKEQAVKVFPGFLQQSGKSLVHGDDGSKESKKLSNSWTLNSQHLHNDVELAFAPTKPGDFVLAQAWNFTNGDNTMFDSSPTSKMGRTFSVYEKKTEFGGDNSLVSNVVSSGTKETLASKSSGCKATPKSENIFRASAQPESNILVDDVTSSTDPSPIPRQMELKELKLKTPEISPPNLGKQDSAPSTNFRKMQLAGHTNDTKVSFDSSSDSSTTTTIINKSESKSKNGVNSSNYSFPAWLYCTRYSDRPSSGPRCRRKKKLICEVDEKRSRTAFSSTQLARLRQEFQANRYLTEKRRTTLASELELSESQVKIWFQNKRAKLKKAAGRKNPLALQLMAQGLYNHSSQK